MPSARRFRVSLALAAALASPVQAAPSRWLDFSLSSAALAQACAQAWSRADSRLGALAALPAGSATYQTAFVALSDVVSDLNDETSGPMFLGQVSTDKGVRDAGIACDTEISKRLIEVYSREDLYKLLKAAAARKEALDPESRRLVEKTLLEFKRSGLDFPPETRAKVRELKQRVIALQNDFQKNLAEEKSTATFTKAQLAGLPDDFVRRLAKDGDRYVVTLDYPDYFPFMENARDPEARRILETKFNGRGGETNVKLLEETLRLRDESAKLLGYPDHASYVLEERMAKNPAEARKFLTRLEARLMEKARPELQVLLSLKAEELGDGSDGILHAWDWRYYHNQLLKTRYQVDDQLIKEYFPVDLVTEGMLEVYQTVLGLKFREVRPAEAWHEDVKLYEVTDAATSELAGYFYMDLFPREGKYKHAAAFTLVPGRLMPDGKYQRPVSAIVANFNKPTAEAPSLLTHDEVETYFHEFGHIMHQVLTRAKYERFSGTSVARDFVEAPSQMLENWVWQEKVLESLSGHYKDRSKKLPAEILMKMLEAKNVDSGLKYLRQVFFSTYDLTIHTTGVKDSTELYAQLMEDIGLIPMTPGTRPQASFGHLMGGYDSSYYGYLWSEVYAQDMFSRFEREGVLNPAIGREYRRRILEPGGGIDEGLSLRLFLGREPNEEAFLRHIGLETGRGRAAPLPR